MAHRVRHLSFLFVLWAIPGAATSQQPSIGIADLPPVTMAVRAAYGLNRLTTRPDTGHSRGTAMLDRLFAPISGFSTSDHRHAASIPIGNVALTGEIMRVRMLTAMGAADPKIRVFDRVSAIGLHADWPAGANDMVSLGMAGGKDKHIEPTTLAGTTRIKGTTFATQLSWTHDDHLQMSVGWQIDRSASNALGAERLVELAQGAPLREQGIRMMLSYVLDGADSSRNAAFGLAARDARIAAGDLAILGNADRQDMQAALFFRSAF